MQIRWELMRSFWEMRQSKQYTLLRRMNGCKAQRAIRLLQKFFSVLFFVFIIFFAFSFCGVLTWNHFYINWNPTSNQSRGQTNSCQTNRVEKNTALAYEQWSAKCFDVVKYDYTEMYLISMTGSNWTSNSLSKIRRCNPREYIWMAEKEANKKFSAQSLKFSRLAILSVWRQRISFYLPWMWKQFITLHVAIFIPNALFT